MSAYISDALFRFRASISANIAVIFALAMVPILGFVGAAVDFSKVSLARTEMQNALDQAALMAAKDSNGSGWTPAQMDAAVKQYFAALYNRPDVTNIVIGSNYTATGNPSLVLTGSGSISTDFMKVIGTPSMSFNLSSTVAWGGAKLRLALVLDNTGSMNDNGKLAALQSATKSLLKQLQSLATVDGDVYVSVLPFNKDINVDPQNKNAKWLDWTEWDNNNGTCTGTGSTSTNCQGKWKPANHKTWNGCVSDRGDIAGPSGSNYDTNVSPPVKSDVATLYAAEQWGDCLQIAMGLSYDWSTMATLIDGMVAKGNTNQAIGLQMGWMSLVGGGPFTAPAQVAGETYQQYIILLTDGLNTQDRWYSDQISIDNRQNMTCNNIKASGIQIFTIQVNTSGDPTSSLLRNCASDTSKYFLLTSSSDILPTFQAIGATVSKLRITK